MSTTEPQLHLAGPADHVAAFAYLGYAGKRAHLIHHGRRLDLIGPLTGAQMSTLHALLHAGPPEGCTELLPEEGTTHE